MVSWNKRLGFLVPSANSVVERDTRIALPAGTSAHFARMKLTRDTPEGISGLVNHVPQAAGELADAAVDVVGFACTTGSLDGGLGYDRKIIDTIERETGIRATTTSTSVVHGLRELRIQRPVIISPYEEWLNAKVVTFLEGSGFQVAAVMGFGLPAPRDVAGVTPAQILDAARREDRADADGVFISCTDFRGLEAAEMVEQALGKPVVTSNQATIWEMLSIVGIGDPVVGFGQLLARPRRTAEART